MDASAEEIEVEIQELESRLRAAKIRRSELTFSGRDDPKVNCTSGLGRGASDQGSRTALLPPQPSSHHFLLLLSDSALPLGSFAFSSGLESYLAHSRLPSPFSHFLPVSIASYASTTLPFVLAAYKDPSAVAELDDLYDAAIICAVGRRASVAQGRALLSIWERSFAASVPNQAGDDLKDFSSRLRSVPSSGPKTASADGAVPPVSAHLAPLFGVVANLVGLTLHQTAYVFMLGHVKALISAAVRASLFGPYQAQKVLASSGVQSMLTSAFERGRGTLVEDAGQSVPVLDLWVGRHELLYSRIFNS